MRTLMTPEKLQARIVAAARRRVVRLAEMRERFGALGERIVRERRKQGFEFRHQSETRLSADVWTEASVVGAGLRELGDKTRAEVLDEALRKGGPI